MLRDEPEDIDRQQFFQKLCQVYSDFFDIAVMIEIRHTNLESDIPAKYIIIYPPRTF